MTDVPMANIATKVILGAKLNDLGYSTGLKPASEGVYVKAPVFSFAKLRNVDISLGPEMKSTGEVIGKDQTFEKALYKGLVASGIHIRPHGAVLLTIADKDKEEAIELARRFYEIGYQLLATNGTAETLRAANIPVTVVNKIHSESPNILDVIRQGKAQVVINTLTKGKQPESDGFRIRREAVENGIPCLTSLDTAKAMLQVIESMTFSTTAMSEKKVYA